MNNTQRHIPRPHLLPPFARSWWLVIVLGVLGALGGREARADAIQAPGSWLFRLPSQAGGWHQDWVGKPLAGKSVGPIKRARDKKDAATLTIFVINADGAGTPAEIEARLPKFISVEGVEVDGAKITSAVFGKGKEEQLPVQVGFGSDSKKEPVTLRASTATLNGKACLIAIINFEKTTNILVGVPGTDAGKPLFEKISRDLVVNRQTPQKPKPPTIADVRSMFAVKSITASSTKAGKRFAAHQALANAPGFSRTRPSAWCEGKRDAGVGESLTITFAQPVEARSIDVTGLDGTNNLTSVTIGLDGEKPVTLKIAGDRWGSLTLTRKVTTVVIAIASATKRGANDSCLAVQFTERVDGSTWDVAALVGFDANALAALPDAITALQEALFEDGRAKLQPLVGFPFSNRHDGGKKKVVHKDWKSLAKACVGDGSAAGCPQTADNGGPFLDPMAGAPGTLDLLFTRGYQATTEIVWRLKWSGSAWKLIAVDYRAKQRGAEGSGP
jgi:hypothetical protein